MLTAGENHAVSKRIKKSQMKRAYIFKHVTGSIMCHFCYAMNETQKPLTPRGCMEVRAAPRSARLWRAHPEVSSLQGLQKLMLHGAEEWPCFPSRAA